MKRAQKVLGRGVSLVAFVVAALVPATALADDPYGLAPGSSAAAVPAAPSATELPRALSTWGGASASVYDPTSTSRDAPVTQARELVSRARFLDEAAATDEKSATELAARLPALRASAKVARERATRAAPEERELLGARAEDLETDVIVSDAEVTFRRRTAAENRRVARELRLRAVKLVREAPAVEDRTASMCDPPFRLTAEGRKVYRVECLK